MNVAIQADNVARLKDGVELKKKKTFIKELKI